jgi:hypothetical protein
MSCRIKTNKKGQITKVEDAQGESSVLFNYILKLPHVKSAEQALEVYQEALKKTEDNSKLSKDEMESDFTFQAIYNSLLEGDTLEQAAKQNDLYVEDVQDGKELIGKGDENVVYDNNDGTVTKVNNLSMHDSPMEFFQRVAINNMLFPEAKMTIVGVTTRGNDIAVVVEQDKIEGETPTSNEIREDLKARGFTEREPGTFVNPDYIIQDVMKGNAVRTEDGIVYTDAAIYLNNEEEYAGKRVQKDPVMTIESGGKTYSSFKEALLKSDSDYVDFKVAGQTVLSLPTTTDDRTTQGAINNLIIDGLVNEEMTYHQGKKYFTPKGDTYFSSSVTLEFFKEKIGKVFSRDRWNVKDGLIEIKEESENEVDESSAVRIISKRVLEYFSSDPLLKMKDPISESNLRENLYDILTQMGVSVVSLEEYQRRFKNKSKGIPQSASALVDVANKVIAFKNAEISTEDLTEEVMHLIVETLEQSEIDELMTLVEQTPEYAQYYQQYADTYNETDARKEVLGKVMRNIALAKVEGKPESLLRRVINILKNFFDKLMLNEGITSNLDRLNTMVDKLVIQQDGAQFTNDSLKNSRQIELMYSLQTPTSIKAVSSALETIMTNARDSAKHLGSYSRQLKNKNYENIEASEIVSATSSFIEIIDQLSFVTNAAISQSEVDGKALSGQNKAMLDSMAGNLTDELRSLAAYMKSGLEGVPKKQTRKLSEKMEEQLAYISSLKGTNSNIRTTQLDVIVDDILQQLGKEESIVFRKRVKDAVNGQAEDINLVYRFFGQMHHSSNPILNLISSKLFEMNMKADEGTKKTVSEILNFLKDKKLDYNTVYKMLFDDKGWLIDQVDHKALQDKYMKIDMEATNEVLGTKYKDLKTYEKDKKNQEIEFSDEQFGLFKTSQEKRRLEVSETIMKPNYYESKLKKYSDLGISGAAQLFLKNLSVDRSLLKYEARNDEGYIEYTPFQKDMIGSLAAKRRAAKSIYSDVNMRKKGIKLHTQEVKDSVKLTEGVYITLDLKGLNETEANSAKITYDINNLDNDYLNDLENKKGTDGAATNTTKDGVDRFIVFIGRLSEKQSGESIYDVILANLDISLNSKFYDDMPGESFLKGDTLEKNNPGKEDTVKTLKKLHLKRRSILSKFRNAGVPFETDKMHSSDQKDIRKISKEISKLTNSLKIPDMVKSELGESSVNESYLNDLDSRDIEQMSEDELDFLEDKDHSNKDNYTSFKQTLAKFRRGGLDMLTEKEEARLENYLEGNKTDTQIKVEYLRNNLYPYYKRFTVKDYQSPKRRLDNGENIVTILNSILENDYLDIKVDSSFEDSESNEALNLNHKKDWQGGIRQPKQELYKKGGELNNPKYEELFAPDSNGKATKNKDIFEVRRLFLEAKRDSMDKMSDTTTSLFKPIQISQTATEKIRTILKGKDKKALTVELIKDAFAYRTDDKAYGEKNFEESHVIPKYYLNDLESEEDVSKDHFFALVQLAARSNEYKSKKDILSDIDVLHGTLQSKSPSRQKELKNTLAMAESYIDSSIYGKIENRTYKIRIPKTDYEIDLAKTFRVFTKYVSLKNLGFNIHVPLTGFLTAKVAIQIEKFIGERINPQAYKLANSTFNKLAKDAMKQSLDTNDTSVIFMMGQAFGQYNMGDKVRNGKYNTFQRTFSKSAMGLHTISNFPIIPKIILTALYDNKIVNGKVYTKSEYVREMTREGKQSSEEIEANWGLEENPIYDYMDFNKNGFEWKESVFKKDFMGDKTEAEFRQYLEGRKRKIKEDVSDQVSRIDGQIPQELRTTAQRDVLGGMTMLHKGFAAIILQNRFKSKQVSLATGMVEEGSYRSIGRLFKEFFNMEGNPVSRFNDLYKSLKDAPKKPDTTGMNKKEKEAAEEQYAEDILDYEIKVRNIKRVSIELGSLTSLALIVSMILLASDDDEYEDMYLMQASNYLLTRTLNESTTSLGPNIAFDVASAIESPIVTYQSAVNLVKFWELADFSEVKGSRYKGLTTNQRYIIKNTVGTKGIYDIMSANNLSRAKDSYETFNATGLNWSTLGIANIRNLNKD